MAKKPPKPQVSPPAPFEQIQETAETPDVQEFRAYNPLTSSMLKPALTAKFNQSRQQIRDSYGAYTGIPSQVLRNRMRDEALRELDETEALALAEGDERLQALRMAQLEALAGLTKKTKSSGFNTSVVQPQQGPSTIGGLLSGGASVASAAAAIA